MGQFLFDLGDRDRRIEFDHHVLLFARIEFEIVVTGVMSVTRNLKREAMLKCSRLKG